MMINTGESRNKTMNKITFNEPRDVFKWAETMVDHPIKSMLFAIELLAKLAKEGGSFPFTIGYKVQEQHVDLSEEENEAVNKAVEDLIN